MNKPETPTANSADSADSANSANRAGPSEWIGKTIAGRYKIEALLGEGGMGAVYLVEHVAIHKRMALKVLRPEMLKVPEVVARFEREAMAAANIDHPNVAAATDYGRTEDGGFFLVLEFVEGKRLRDVLKEGALSVSRAVHITRQVANALVRAHELGLVHRDLKPENIMLTRREGRSDFVKVLDFGLVKLSPAMLAQGGLPGEQKGMSSSPKLTQAGSIFGTPAYMAPEQAMNEPVDIRSDLYSVGVILYEMLAGRNPFEGSTVLDQIRDHLATAPPPFKLRAPDVTVPEKLEMLTQRLLAKKADERFLDPNELVAALDALEIVVSPSASGAMERAASSPEVRSGSAVGRAVTALSNRISRRLAQVGAVLRPVANRLPSPLNRVPLWLLVISVLLGTVSPLLIQWLVSSPRQPVGTAAGGSAGRIAVTPALVPQELLDGAAARGPQALEGLAAQFPNDPHVLRILALAYRNQHQLLEALRVVGRHAALDPKTGQDKELVNIVVAALQGGQDTMNAAVVLMEQELGEAGVDLLYDLTVKQTQLHWKARVNQSLTKPEVLAKASSATRVALDLRAAKSCPVRAALLPRVQREGGERALALLKTMEQRDGCGFLGMSDCWPCLRKDSALKEAIETLEARPK